MRPTVRLLAAIVFAAAPFAAHARTAHAQAAARGTTRAPATITVTDIRGRTVRVPSPARRLVIDDGRYLVALALIHPDPVSVLAGWPRDVNRIGPRVYDGFRTRFPRIDSIPQTSSSSGGGSAFSVEKAIAVHPDVAVFTAGLGPSDDEVKQIEAAGIPVVFLDFFGHPFANLEPSLRVLGQLTGRDAAAKAFLDFRRTHMARIAERLRANPKAGRPKVFLEAHAGISDDCCNSPGRGNIGDYIAFVGGHNIGADVIPGPTGKLNVEYVMSQDPAVYVMTGGPHLERTGGLVVGPGYTPERARASLEKMTQRTGIALLPAVRRGAVHGIAHQLLNSPLDVVAIEALAKWVHPALFRDVDPRRTLADINARFLVVPLDGTQWIDLR